MEERKLLAATPVQDWSSYVGRGEGWPAAATVADTDGNVYVGGYDREVTGTDVFGRPVTIDHGYVAKLSSQGVLLWKAAIGDRRGVSSLALDASGNVYAAGGMRTPEINVSEWDEVTKPRRFNNYDGFLTKIGPDGTVIRTTRIGGILNESATAVAVDAQGNVYVCGQTSDAGFYQGSAYSAIVNHNDWERAYVARLDESGSIAWVRMLDGLSPTAYSWSGDDARAIAVDLAGNVYVTGRSYGVSGGGFDTTSRGWGGAGVAKFSPTGTMLWSSRLGGDSLNEIGRAVVVDQAGTVYVAGRTVYAAGITVATGWTSGGFDTSYGGGWSDGFIARINADGTLGWTSYVGGAGDDEVNGLTVDQAGNVLAVGVTGSSDWTASGVNAGVAGTDGFVVKVTAEGGLLWSSHLGGSDYDAASAVTVDESGTLYVTGSTKSTDWISGGFDTEHGTDAFRGFIARIEQATLPVVVEGTEGADRIDVGVDGGEYVVSINGQSTRYGRVDVQSLTIYGRGGNDTIIVNPSVSLAVSVYAGAGDDSVVGGAGDDLIEGGEGDDTVIGGAGSDTVYGHDGADQIEGGAGDDELYGNAGNDTLYGGAGDDAVFGQGNDDVLYGNFGDDTMDGGDGADELRAGLGADSLTGGSGNDSLYGGDQSDTINGQEGDDYIEGKGKADSIDGGSGNDTIWGGAGADSVRGGEGDDWIDAGPGEMFVDTVDAGAGRDTVVAGTNDLLVNVEVSILG